MRRYLTSDVECSMVGKFSISCKFSKFRNKIGKEHNKFIIITVVLFAFILVGEVIVESNTYHYDSAVEWNLDSVSYSVTSSSSARYDVVLIDNHGVEPISKLWIYSGSYYEKYHTQVDGVKGLIYCNLDYYNSQLVKALNIRGFTDVEICNEDTLAEVVNNENSKGIGIISLSYELPSSIYSGSESDPLFKWIHSGGHLYWSGSEIGKYYADDSGLYEVNNNQNLFFGVDCINTRGVSGASCMIEAGGLTKALSLYCSNVLFGLDTSKLNDYLSVGFAEDDYSSITFVKSGTGMICVVGGEPGYYRTDDISQVISAGLTYASVLSSHYSGTVNGHEYGKMSLDGGDYSLYVYFGGYYLVKGDKYNE